MIPAKGQVEHHRIIMCKEGFIANMHLRWENYSTYTYEYDSVIFSAEWYKSYIQFSTNINKPSIVWLLRLWTALLEITHKAKPERDADIRDITYVNDIQLAIILKYKVNW